MIEEFKREINGVIRRKLMKAENQPGSIEQWYKKAITLDRNWRESRREEEERLREKKEQIKSVLRDSLPRLQVWLRRQETSTTAVPTPMKGVERTNAVIIRNLE